MPTLPSSSMKQLTWPARAKAFASAPHLKTVRARSMDSIATTTRPCSASSVTDVSSAARTGPSSRRVGASLRISRSVTTSPMVETSVPACAVALQPGARDVEREAPGNRVVDVQPLGYLAIGPGEALEVDPARLGHDDVEGPLDHFQVVEVESEFG